MFSQANPVIVQIRRELRGQLPDNWVEEVVQVLEYQLSYSTVDELHTDDLLKLKIGSEKSATLNQAMTRVIQQFQPAPPPVIDPIPQTLSHPWKRLLPWQ